MWIKLLVPYSYFNISYVLPTHIRNLPEHCTECLFTVNNNFIVGGNLNAKHIQWGCHAPNPRGNSLSYSNFSILPCFSSKLHLLLVSLHKNILNIFITEILNNLHTQTLNLLDPCSDDLPVLL